MTFESSERMVALLQNSYLGEIPNKNTVFKTEGEILLQENQNDMRVYV